MKKISLFVTSLLFALMLSFSACTGCNKTQDETVDSTETVALTNTATLNVEHITAADKESMYMQYGGEYRWFETCIQLEDFLDDENCDGTIHSISNVFQVVENIEDDGADVFVVLYAHLADTSAVDVKHGFWVEDLPMNDEAIVVTFEQAFEKLMEANCPKPHSRNCVLRKQLGPVNTNPQYIFGNTRAQVYVDATTGDVRTSNPVFPEEKGFTMPLGEWP